MEDIIQCLLSAVFGGGLVKIVTLRSERKKAAVEVKVNEIEAIHNTVEMVYQPIIQQQNNRIKELEDEVRKLRIQLSEERSEHQKEIDMMNKRILSITEVLGIKATDHIKANGQKDE